MTTIHHPHRSASAAFEDLLVVRAPRPSLISILKRWLHLT